MQIAGFLPCSFVNGDGARFVVFVQGCAHGCFGCQNRDTWDFAGGAEWSVEALADEIKPVLARHPIDGITLSGGDPYYQPGEVRKLLELLPGVDCWIYTGFEWNQIKNDTITQLASHVVCGPYKAELRCSGKMYGSSNQYIVDTRTGKVVG